MAKISRANRRFSDGISNYISRAVSNNQTTNRQLFKIQQGHCLDHEKFLSTI